MEKLLSEFVEFLTRESKSPETIKGYTKTLRQFLTVLCLEKPSDINKDSIEKWKQNLRDRNICIGHIANHLWAIRKFTKFLKYELKVSDYDFDVPIPFPKAPEAVEFMEQEELDQLVKFINLDDIHGLRTRTYIEVMLNTGLRPSEALSLDREQVQGDVKELELVGKGKKRRKIYINERARVWINRYLSRREDSFPALFVTHCKPKRLSLRHAETTFKQALQKAGIKKRIRLHDLRHTYGTNLLIHGCPVDYVAVLMGHSSIETTRRHYLAVRQKHAKNAHFKYLNLARY